MNAPDWRFPMACPGCEAVAGTPHRALADEESLSIEVRCTACGHEWDISAPSPTVFLKAKRDRRSLAKPEVPPLKL